MTGDSEMANEKTTKFLQGIRDAGGTASEVLGGMKSAFGGMDEGLDMAMNAASSIVDGFAQGGLVGGIAAAAGQLISITTNMIGAKREIDQGLINFYNNYVELLSDLIDKNMALLDKLGGSAFDSTIKDTISAINKQYEASRNLLNEAAKAGSSAGSHSYGYRANKMLQGYNKELKAIGIHTTDWAKMTDEQLMKLKELPEVYAKLPSQMREYIEAMIEAKDKAEELKEQLQEMLLGFDASDITSAIVDSLTDSSIDDAMGDLGSKIDGFIGSVIKNMIVKNGLISAIQPLIDNLMKGIAVYDKDGNITGFKNTSDLKSSIFADFKNGIMKVAEGFKEQWAAISDTLQSAGIDINDSNSGDREQSATSKGFTAMSQDTGDELNGRFTALQMSGIHLEHSAASRNELLSSINAEAIAFRGSVSLIGMSVDEIKDINRQSMNHLYKIEKNTALLHSTNELLGKVVSNTANL